MINFSEDKKRLLSNFFSLLMLKGMNMILPLITLPYLVRVLGVEKFGLINFALSIIMYFNILVSFGFDLSATREISVHRDNNKKVSEIFSSVMVIKIFLTFLSFLLLSMLVMFFEPFNSDSILYYLTFGIVIGNVLFPSWFFQGMERMKYITYINIISKLFFTILIFILVKKSNDYIYVPILNALGAIIGGIYSLWLIFKVFKVHVIIPSKKVLFDYFKESYHFFLSRVANDGSRYMATTIIGLYFGNKEVGYYSMVEKLFYAFMNIGGIVSQTIYPYMSRTKNIIFFKKIFIFVILISIILLGIIYLYQNDILFLVFKLNDKMLSDFFSIVFIGAMFGIASSLLGYPLLAAFGYIKYANNSLIYASIIYVLYIILTSIYFHNIYLVVFSLCVYEIVGLILRLYYIKKTKIL